MGNIRMFLAVALIVASFCELISSKVECEDMVFIERGQRGMISCEFPLSFIAVFWYRGDSQNPFLRLEEGRPTKIDGYDITARGEMIIENVKIEDEGPYRISVLDADGASQSGYTLINVTVSLSTNPHIDRCETSESEICHLVEDNIRPKVVVCHTTDTMPEVTFVWLTTSSSIVVENIYSKSVMNITTGLYISYSVFQYDSSSFSLEYVTCNATGLAVNEIRNASVFVAGSKNDVPNNNHVTIKQGSVLAIKCADKKFILQKWSYEDPEGNIAELKSVYPGQESGPCLSNARCEVNKEGFLMITDSSFKDEGTYECIYSDEVTSGRSLTNIEVIITPNPPEILIEGCKSQARCTKDVGFTGDLKAFLYESRPPLEILCEINEESKSHAYIFDHHNTFEGHPVTGTFDTIYTVKYDIQKCSSPVHVTCKTLEKTKITISPSLVYLATDQSTCNSKGKPGLIAFIVILLIVFIFLGTVTFWKRENVRIFVQNCSSSSQVGKVDTANLKSEQDESVKPLLCNQFCDRVHKNKSIPAEDFEEILNQYQTENDDTTFFDSISNHLKSSPHDKETVYAAMSYLLTLMPRQNIPIVQFCELLGHFVKQNTLSADKFLVVMNALLDKKLILLEKYIEMTGPLLSLFDMDRRTMITNLKDLISKTLITKEELVESLMHYFSFYKMETEAILKAVAEFKTNICKIPYPYFLQGIFNWKYKIDHSVDQKNALLFLYNDIVKEHIKSQGEGLLIKKEDAISDPQDISCTYVQALLCSTAQGAIGCEACWNIIADGMEKRNINASDCFDAYKRCIENDWIQGTKLADILRLLLNKNQITHSQFREDLCKARTNKQISPEIFKSEIASAISKKEVDQGEWIKFTVDMWRQKLIADDEKNIYMVVIADTYMIERDLFKPELVKLGMSLEQRRLFLRPISFKEDPEYIKVKSLAQRKPNSPRDKNVETIQTPGS